MKELKEFRNNFPEQRILPGLQPSPRELLEVIRQQTEKTGIYAVSRESILTLFSGMHVPRDSPLGEFLDEVVDDITYSEENQV